MRYYYAIYEELYDSYHDIGYSYSLNNARKNLMHRLMRYNDPLGIVATDPIEFSEKTIGKKYLVGEVWELADPRIPYNYHWRAKGKKNMVPLNKDGSLKNGRRR